MALLDYTMKSGHRFEDQVMSVVKKYTRVYWRNIRIETLLTSRGSTEIDILFCYKGITFITEAKNVSQIVGDYGSRSWEFVGTNASSATRMTYMRRNVITQNNIHTRSFKDLYFEKYGEWPVVVPIIVVPNSCLVSEELAPYIHTLNAMNNFLASASDWDANSVVSRKVSALLTGASDVVRRPCFTTNEKGVRCKSWL